MADKDVQLLKSEDDRIKSYINKQFLESPKDFAKSTRGYLVAGAILNIFAFVYFAMGHFHIISENANTPLNLSSIDGVIVKEGQDIRRDVMLRNALQKTSDKSEGRNAKD